MALVIDFDRCKRALLENEIGRMRENVVIQVSVEKRSKLFSII